MPSHIIYDVDASLVAQTIKIPPAMRETWVRSLGGEDPLEKEMALNVLCRKISIVKIEL